MSKPGGDPSSGISSVDVLRPTERHPACRQREARPGCRMERENLASDAEGKGASGSNREAESTDAPERGGLPRSWLYGHDAGGSMDDHQNLGRTIPGCNYSNDGALRGAAARKVASLG